MHEEIGRSAEDTTEVPGKLVEGKVFITVVGREREIELVRKSFSQ